MDSGIYRGTIRHRRFAPKLHNFRYQVFMMYLDLAELDSVFRGSWLWSSKRPALAWFRRKDFLQGALSLDTAVRDRIEKKYGERPGGPIRLLTNLRYFGYIINPISCYYCFEPDGVKLSYIVLEVTNTPWGEKVDYILRCDPDHNKQRINFTKELHVSPFLPMNLQYRWYGNTPAATIAVHLQDFDGDTKIFDASLSLHREEISVQSLRANLLQYPVMTMKVCVAIYWQALKLFLIKRVPFYTNPQTVQPRS